MDGEGIDDYSVPNAVYEGSVYSIIDNKGRVKSTLKRDPDYASLSNRPVELPHYQTAHRNDGESIKNRTNGNSNSRRTCCWLFLVLVLFFSIVIACASLIFAYLEITKLNSRISSLPPPSHANLVSENALNSTVAALQKLNQSYQTVEARQKLPFVA